MEDLENKIQEELTSLKDQLAKIQADSHKFTDLEELRRETGERRNRLILEQEDLAEKKNEIQAQVNRLQTQYDSLQVSRKRELFFRNCPLYYQIHFDCYIRWNWTKMKPT